MDALERIGANDADRQLDAVAGTISNSHFGVAHAAADEGLDEIGGDGEIDLRAANARDRDADNGAAPIDHRAPRIARIHAALNLDLSDAAADIAAHRRHRRSARGHGLAQLAAKWETEYVNVLRLGEVLRRIER